MADAPVNFSFTDSGYKPVLGSSGNCLRQIFEQFPLSVVITGPNRRVLWTNRAFTEMCGYSLGELAGNKPGDLLQGPESDPLTIATMAEAVHEGRACEVELLNYHKTGKTYWASIYIAPVFSPTGEIDFYFAVEREITREREIQEGKEGYLLTLYDRLSRLLECPPPGPDGDSLSRN